MARASSLAVGNDRQFGALCEVLGVPELAADPRYLANRDRVTHRVELAAALQDALAADAAPAWAERLTHARVPAGVVNDIAGAFTLAEAVGLDPIVNMVAEDGRMIRLPKNPIGLSKTPPTYRSAPPDFLSEDQRPTD